jgi:phosphatidylglycerol lysyltransferase
VLVSTWWLGMIVYGDTVLNLGVLWQADWENDSARFARFMLTAGVSVTILILSHLLYPAPSDGHILDDDNMEVVRTIIRGADDPLAALVLQGDKYLLFSPGEDAMLQYGIRGRTWVALGDPVGNPAVIDELIWRFRLASLRSGGRVVYYQVGKRYERTYLEMGLGLFRLGDVGRVALDGRGISNEMEEMATRHERQGMTMSVIPPEGVGVHMARLRSLSDEWRQDRGSGEKSFAIGNFEETYVGQFPIMLVRQDGKVTGFANVITVGAEVSLDVVRISPTAPPSTLEYMFVRIQAWAQRIDATHLNLGLVPTKDVDDRLVGPLWTRAGELLYPHGEHFYNYRALRAFKDRFAPEWTPRYIAAPGGIELPGVLRDVEALISGGVRGAIGP